MVGAKRARAAAAATAASPAPCSRQLPLTSPERGPRTSALRLLLLLFLSERPQQWRRDPDPPFPSAPPFSSSRRACPRSRHLKGGRDEGGRGRAAAGKGRGRGVSHGGGEARYRHQPSLRFLRHGIQLHRALHPGQPGAGRATGPRSPYSG